MDDSLPAVALFHSSSRECSRLRAVLASKLDVHVAQSPSELRGHLATASPRVVLAEMLLPTARGVELVRSIRRASPSSEVVVVSPVDAVSLAVAAVKAGAFGFVSAHHRPEEILSVAVEALEQVELNRASRSQPVEELPASCSPRMLETLNALPAVARSETAVLIAGEVGSGRLAVARAVHNLSVRGAPMCLVDGAQASRTSLADRLAVMGRADAHNATQGGQPSRTTLCVVNVDQLPEQDLEYLTDVCSQPTVVRLPDGSGLPVRYRLLGVVTCGGEAHSNTRGHGAHRRLRTLRASLFADSLIEVPSLRQRVEDLPSLWSAFAHRWARRYGGSAKQLTSSAREVLSTYGWPGNLHELSNLIERLTLTCPSTLVDASFLPIEFHLGSWKRGLTYRDAMARLERELLQRTLARAGGCRRRAAERLQLSYSTLKYRLRKVSIAHR